ncbi:hypothetical protein GA0116948_105127 [Chitinophaga costaii]|uniref:Uncharacterized protein n=1 Tax=Chitinophaga costaii TaxID=1335309 RepID=A0A1C4D8C3_9BACT|nr:hypothetical protein [Chitinophaga costaii]PUZ24504.1 hypothetical protein DCM91_11405 [Chitinophaga costaii]SCC27621.1 hypothetical protein GA0116948_105127 [Chitinophaga costaii]
MKVGTILYAGGARVDVAGLPTSGSSHPIFALSIQFPDNNIVPGTYATSDIGNNFSLTKSNGDVIFAATSLEQGNVVTIQVTAYDSIKQVISGTFSGLSYNYEGDNAPVTHGNFKATLTKVN